MNAKLVAPELGSLDDDPPATPPAIPRPDLRAAPRRPEPLMVESLVKPGFVSEVSLPPEPTEPSEVLTIEVPRRLKRALQAEVVARKDDPDRRAVASMKSVILEALAVNGFGHLISQSDIEVQAGIFMKRQAAQLRRKG